ncbi:MAG: hypothetical protein R3E73_13185 [Porticoccaceae bacterium]
MCQIKTITLADGSQAKVATVYDLMMANYGIDRGLGGGNVASSYDDETVIHTRLAGKNHRC